MCIKANLLTTLKTSLYLRSFLLRLYTYSET